MMAPFLVTLVVFWVSVCASADRVSHQNRYIARNSRGSSDYSSGYVPGSWSTYASAYGYEPSSYSGSGSSSSYESGSGTSSTTISSVDGASTSSSPTYDSSAISSTTTTSNSGYISSAVPYGAGYSYGIELPSGSSSSSEGETNDTEDVTFSEAFLSEIFVALDSTAKLGPAPLVIDFPIEDYEDRYESVLKKRTARWTVGVGVGGECHVNGKRCTLGLLCVRSGISMVCQAPDNPRALLHKNVPLTEVLRTGKELYNTRLPKWFENAAQNEPCTLAHVRCSIGLLCVGAPGEKICRPPVADGEACDDDLRICALGSMCMQGTCLKQLAEGAFCKVPHAACGHGLHCGVVTCTPMLKEFETCIMGRGCGPGLTCDFQTCRSIDGLGHRALCNPTAAHPECKRGLVCDVTYDTATCKEAYGSPPLSKWGCKEGQHVVDGICYGTLQKGEPCAELQYDLCAPGLLCTLIPQRWAWIIVWECADPESK